MQSFLSSLHISLPRLISVFKICRMLLQYYTEKTSTKNSMCLLPCSLLKSATGSAGLDCEMQDDSTFPYPLGDFSSYQWGKQLHTFSIAKIQKIATLGPGYQPGWQCLTAEQRVQKVTILMCQIWVFTHSNNKHNLCYVMILSYPQDMWDLFHYMNELWQIFCKLQGTSVSVLKSNYRDFYSTWIPSW